MTTKHSMLRCLPRTHNLQFSYSSICFFLFHFTTKTKWEDSILFMMMIHDTQTSFLSITASQHHSVLSPLKVRKTSWRKDGDENWYLFLWLYKVFTFCQSWGFKRGARGMKRRCVGKFANCKNLLRLRFLKKLYKLEMICSVLKLLPKTQSF